MIPASARQSAIAHAAWLESERERKIPDSPVVVVEDSTFARWMECKAGMTSATTEVKFEVFRSIVTFILVQIHWADASLPAQRGEALIYGCDQRLFLLSRIRSVQFLNAGMREGESLGHIH